LAKPAGQSCISSASRFNRSGFRQLELLELLQAMSEAGHAQFIIATHSPILLSCPGARLCGFDRIPVRQVRFEETDHYRICREFLEDPARPAAAGRS